jgi:hypothetical protein
MSNPSTSRISSELIDMFIANLHGDLDALKACSLVHSGQWLDSSRRLLFNHIRVNYRDTHDFFPILLSDSNTIARHIRQLALDLNYHGDTLDMSAFFPVLSKLSSIEELSIEFGEITMAERDVSASKIVVSGLTSLTKLNLTYICFDTSHHFASLLHCLPFLQALHIYGVTWTRDTVTFPYYQIPQSLQTLVVKKSPVLQILGWILSHHSRPEVNTLDLDCIPQSIVNNYIQSLTKSLRQLRFSLHPQGRDSFSGG